MKSPKKSHQWMTSSAVKLGGAIAPLLTIRNEQEYEQAIERLNDLIDEIGTNEQHPLLIISLIL